MKPVTQADMAWSSHIRPISGEYYGDPVPGARRPIRSRDDELGLLGQGQRVAAGGRHAQAEHPGIRVRSRELAPTVDEPNTRTVSVAYRTGNARRRSLQVVVEAPRPPRSAWRPGESAPPVSQRRPVSQARRATVRARTRSVARSAAAEMIGKMSLSLHTRSMADQSQ